MHNKNLYLASAGLGCVLQEINFSLFFNLKETNKRQVAHWQRVNYQTETGRMDGLATWWLLSK